MLILSLVGSVWVELWKNCQTSRNTGDRCFFFSTINFKCTGNYTYDLRKFILKFVLHSTVISHTFWETNSLSRTMQIVECSLLHRRAQDRVSSYPRAPTSICENILYPMCTCPNPPLQSLDAYKGRVNTITITPSFTCYVFKQLIINKPMVTFQPVNNW